LNALTVWVQGPGETIAGCEGLKRSKEHLRKNANSKKKGRTQECPQNDFAERKAASNGQGSNAEYPEDR
jgi:hypothetical protein